MKPNLSVALVAALALHATPAWAHGGGLNEKGCHTNHKTGQHHCHGARTPAPAKPRSKAKPRRTSRPSPQPAEVLSFGEAIDRAAQHAGTFCFRGDRRWRRVDAPGTLAVIACENESAKVFLYGYRSDDDAKLQQYLLETELSFHTRFSLVEEQELKIAGKFGKARTFAHPLGGRVLLWQFKTRARAWALVVYSAKDGIADLAKFLEAANG